MSGGLGPRNERMIRRVRATLVCGVCGVLSPPHP